MKTRGFVLPEISITGVLMAVVAVVGIAALAKYHSDAYDQGKQDQLAADLKQRVKDDDAWKQKLQDAIAAREQAQQSLNTISITLTQETRDAQEALRRLNADIAAGRVRLRDPGTHHVQPADVAPVTNDPGGYPDHGTGGTQLSDEAAQFLSGEAEHCDNVVRKLTSAQAIIRELQKTCR